VDQTWLGKIQPMQEMEKTMLDFAEGVEANSRLSCQIQVTEALDGLTVRMPKSQH
jgi:2Fe-2S ferredoxin